MIYGAAKQLRTELDVSVLAIEYPGYGLLRHIHPSEERMAEAATIAYKYLEQVLKIPSKSIAVLGRSLGGSPALRLAANFPVGSLTLVNAFSSVRDVAASKVGETLAWMSFGQVFDNTKLIGRVQCPVLFIHGASDVTVPPSHSKALFSMSNSPSKLLLEPQGMSHNSSMFENPTFLAQPMRKLLNPYTKGEEPKWPQEVFEPKPLEKIPQSIPSATCTYGLSLCGRECKGFSSLESSCDFAVPSTAVPLGDVRMEEPVIFEMNKATIRMEPLIPRVGWQSDRVDTAL